MWFQDEARVGQKNGITRRWARRGTRPSAPKDQRTASAYIFGAICPKQGKGAAIVMPRCNTAAMTAHLAEISGAVATDAHAVVLLDQAGASRDYRGQLFQSGDHRIEVINTAGRRCRHTT